MNSVGFSALHISSQRGHLAVTKALIKAGAGTEARVSSDGSPPLQLAAERGHSEIMRVLIEAGADVNSRALNGTTSLYRAAQCGHVEAVKLLLRAKADPLLSFSKSSWSQFTPLDVAAQGGYLEVARELIKEHGIEGCGGDIGGMVALRAAAAHQHVEMMGMLNKRRSGRYNGHGPTRCRKPGPRVICGVPVAAVGAEQKRSRSCLPGYRQPP